MNKNEKEKNKWKDYYKSQITAKNWVMFGIFIFITVMIISWGLYIKTTLKQIKLDEQNTPLNKTQQEWDDVFKNIELEQKKEKVKKDLKTIIENIVKENEKNKEYINTSTATSSLEIDNITTSTEKTEIQQLPTSNEINN